MTAPRKVLIIGGGFAGLTCAQRLAHDRRFQVTLVDKQNHHLFQPLLYQVATTSLSAPDIARSLRGILSDADNIATVMDEITAIDLQTKTTKSDKTSYPFDYLILACGARTSFFGNDHWQEHTLGLKNLADAHRIRARVLSALERAEIESDEDKKRRLMTIAIVGGGPTGVELAGAFSDLVRRAMRTDFRNIDPTNLRIILIQSGEKILRYFKPELSDYARKRLEHLGVQVILGPRVDQVEKGRLHLNKPVPECEDICDDCWLEAENIIWAAGIETNSLTRKLGIETDRGGRLPVEPDLSLPGHPFAFAAGDIVNLTDGNDKVVPGLAPAAAQMGKYIANNLKREGEDNKKVAPFKYRDKGAMAIIGKNAAIMETEKFRLNGFFAWLAWLLIHVAFLIGFRAKIFVLMEWAYSYIIDKPGSRVFVNRRPEDLMKHQDS